MAKEVKGFQFPFSINPDTGSWPMTSGKEKFRQNIIEILSTQVGERVMNREFGSDLRRFVHEVNDTSLHALIKDEITEAIHRFEPRVTVLNIEIKQRSREEGKVDIFVGYRINPIQQKQSLSVTLPPE